LRDLIGNRFGALLITLIAVSISPLSLHRFFQVDFSLIGGSAERALKLLEVMLSYKSYSSCAFCSETHAPFDGSKSVYRLSTS
jgi:hypothetical protein